MDTVIGRPIRYPSTYVKKPNKRKVLFEEYKYAGYPPHLKKNLKKAKDFEQILLENIDVEDLKSKTK